MSPAYYKEGKFKELNKLYKRLSEYFRVKAMLCMEIDRSFYLIQNLKQKGKDLNHPLIQRLTKEITHLRKTKEMYKTKIINLDKKIKHIIAPKGYKKIILTQNELDDLRKYKHLYLQTCLKEEKEIYGVSKLFEE